jgi:hypothetical protein
MDDELSRWLADFNRYGGGGDAAFYLSTFNGIFTPVDRVKAGHVSADRAVLSIVGGIQPERLHEQLYSGRTNDGLVSRFLPVWPDHIAPVWEVPEVQTDRLSRILRRLRGLEMQTAQDGRQEPVILPLSREATECFRGWWEENKRLTREEAGLMRDFRGKGDGVVARLAMTLELLAWADGA